MALRLSRRAIFLVPARLKFAVVGCGALGSFYGAKLARAGENVAFLLRSDFAIVQQHGVQIRSPHGDFHVRPLAAAAPEDIGPVDVILIGLKTTANDQLPRLLPPLIHAGTAVITLQNGLGNEEALARFIPPDQILGGLCFVCLNRLAPGLIHHLDHGRVVLGEFNRPALPRTQALADRFLQADIPCEVTEHLSRAHWEKLTWNIPFNGLGVASCAGFDAVRRGQLEHQPPAACLTTDQLLADPRWLELVRDLILEVVRIARAQGHDLDENLVDIQIERTRTMGAYKPSTLIDFERRQPLELHALFVEPLRQGQAVGVNTPRLANLVQVLQQLEGLTIESGRRP
jgi:2-dehydropantoate 2-reductase